LFHNKRHPQEMGVPEIEAFLSHLAVESKVSASTQNQALSALLFLYRHVLHLELDDRVDAIRAKKSQYLPTVLTPEEVKAILTQMTGVHRLVVQILYGAKPLSNVPTPKTDRAVMVKCHYLMPLPKNIRMPDGIGAGSLSFPHLG
jgi:Phage integrase, N-terminal SAM-like domain